MPRQQTYEPTRRARRKQAEAAIQPSTGRVVVEDIDALLDDIDEILEENAVEVVRRYRQQPGQ